MPVDSPCEAYKKIKPQWARIRDCHDGRDAVIKGAAVYAPDLPGADNKANEAYRHRGSFYNATSRTVKGLNGAIFQEAPDVEIVKSFEDILKDITLGDVPFETFAAESGKEVFITGRLGILVDMPIPAAAAQETDTSVEGANVAEPEDMRPYCVSYKAEQIINWRTARQGGDDVLSLVVLHEHVEISDPDDPFYAKTLSQYRVLRLVDGQCLVQLWRALDQGGKLVPFGEEYMLTRRGDPLTFLPFVFLGPLHNGPDIQEPPLLDLADVNLAHWRNSVDYEYGLHLTALPTPWVAGAKAPGDTAAMKIGPAVVWELDATGKAGMLEFTGTGLAAIVVAMEEKKKQMATIGARLLEDSPKQAETATAVRIRHTGETATLKTIAQSIETGLTKALQLCVWWQSTDATPEDAAVNVEVNKEYMDIRATPQEMQVALTMLQAGEIAYETFYNLLQSGGWAREGVDAEGELKDIDARKLDTTIPADDNEPTIHVDDTTPLPTPPAVPVVVPVATGKKPKK